MEILFKIRYSSINIGQIEILGLVVLLALDGEEVEQEVVVVVVVVSVILVVVVMLVVVRTIVKAVMKLWFS